MHIKAQSILYFFKLLRLCIYVMLYLNFKLKFFTLLKLSNDGVLKVVDRAYIIEAGSLKMEGTSAELLNSKEVQKAYLGM